MHSGAFACFPFPSKKLRQNVHMFTCRTLSNSSKQPTGCRSPSLSPCVAVNFRQPLRKWACGPHLSGDFTTRRCKNNFSIRDNTFLHRVFLEPCGRRGSGQVRNPAQELRLSSAKCVSLNKLLILWLRGVEVHGGVDSIGVECQTRW